jgi:hypothetical protein
LGTQRKVGLSSGVSRYLGRLIAPVKTKDSNREVTTRWKYSAAIIHVGDDQTAKSLRQHLQTATLPANYQRFLIQTTEALEKNWEKCRRKWPEPMFPAQATIATGEGKLQIKGLEMPIKYVVWRTPGIDDSSKLSWGGMAVLSEPTSHTDLLGKDLQLTFSDDRKAQVWVHHIENQYRLSFVGGDEPRHAG